MSRLPPMLSRKVGGTYIGASRMNLDPRKAAHAKIEADVPFVDLEAKLLESQGTA